MNIQDLIHLLRKSGNIYEIDKYRDEILRCIPQVEVMLNFEQHNHSHQYDLWEHSLHTVVELPKGIEDDMIYVAALIHDIGKPGCQVEDMKDGCVNMHYYGHALSSMRITKEAIIPHLLSEGANLTKDDQRRLLYYVGHHDDSISLRTKSLRRHLKLGASVREFQILMMLEVADAKAHILLPVIQEKIEICEKLSGEYALKIYNDILEEDQRTRSNVKINKSENI